MKIKNLIIECGDQKAVFKLLDEYKFIGRETNYDLEKLQVIVLALPRNYKKKNDATSKAKANRENLEEATNYTT